MKKLDIVCSMVTLSRFTFRKSAHPIHVVNIMKTIWNQTCRIPGRNPLPGDLDTEVAVIGAGLAGILTAFYLAREGKQVIVLEASSAGSGQTSGTTAKITSQHNLIYQKLLTNLGDHRMKLYARSNQEAIREYERLVRDRSIDCQFEKRPAFLYTMDQPNAIHMEALAARRAGIRASEEVYTELPFSVKRALCFPDQASFHPLRFLEALAASLTIFEHTPVLSVKGHVLTTPHGKVRARKVVFACHYPFPLIPGYYFLRMYQDRSYVLALSQAPRPEGMYLGIDKDGISLRTADQYLLLGGQRHRTGKTNPYAYEMLCDSARQFFPQATVSCKWSAQDCMTLDGLPFIGRFSRKTPDWYVATGFGKWGMTLSMVSAHLLTDLICGRTSPWEALYSPLRFHFRASAPRLAVHTMESSIGLLKGLSPNIMRCPHMGCKLSWNKADSTWDCPCHGSRFDRLGQLITGPSQTPCHHHKLIP